MVEIKSGWIGGSCERDTRFTAKFSGMVFCFVAKIMVLSEPGISTVYMEGKTVAMVVASPLIRRRSPGTLALLRVRTPSSAKCEAAIWKNSCVVMCGGMYGGR